LEEEALHLPKKNQSPLDWIQLADDNIFGILFSQEYREKEDRVAVLSVAMSCKEFDLTQFITDMGEATYKQVTWVAKEEGK